MLKALRNFGITAWIGCILVLGYQMFSWLLTASWPSLTLFGVFYDVFGWDMTSLLRSLSLEYVMKAFYVLTTTEFSLALWWLGVAFFLLAMLWRIFKK